MRLLVISTLAAVAALAAVCAADEDDGGNSDGFSVQFDGWPSGEKLGLSGSEALSLRESNVQVRFQLVDSIL